MSLRPRLGIAWGVSLAVATVVAPRFEGRARASLVVALDLPAMVERADHVAVVDVASVNAAWDDKHERILTTIELSVVEAWKGPMTPASHLRIVQPGGTVGDIQMTVFGMSQFSPGERALVFLRGTPEAASVVGMAQGKRLVRRDAATGRWMVHAPDRAGASFVRLPTAKPNQTPPNQASPNLAAPNQAAPNQASPTAPAAAPPVFETRLRGLDELRSEVRGLVLTPGKATGR